MNGDLGKIYNAITDIKVSIARIETKQEERHTENIRKTDSLFVKADKLSNRPCIGHGKVDEVIRRHDRMIWFIVSIIILLGMKVIVYG